MHRISFFDFFSFHKQMLCLSSAKGHCANVQLQQTFNSSSIYLDNAMKELSAEAKHHILLEYQPNCRAHSFSALAGRHAIPGGGRTVQRWHEQWNGTVQSLQHKAGAGRPRTLSAAHVNRLIRAPIIAANRAHRAVHYTSLLPQVQHKSGADISLRTLQRYGKEEIGATGKRTRKRTAKECKSTEHTIENELSCFQSPWFSLVCPVSFDACEQVAQTRRKLQKRGLKNLMFLDETALRLSEAPTTTIVAPGESAYVIATETSSDAKRYDMIAACVGDRVLVPKIFTPKEKSDASVRGINGAMLKQFINDLFAQAVEGLDRYPVTLVLDRAPIHLDIDAILQEFHDRSSHSIQDILLLPPNSAKRLSPLDNSLFHDWKEKCREHTPLTENNI
jgi:transposase